ncbi:MAG: hypothetical protein HOC77_00590 [Chloroflexi bacterium]|jgi:hypothetical protein|nr:hypothetical protein [Chloroflexota bacterium]MBT4074466.1 hypothetical protein [Chloroflexota bacterium]MBT4513573.1 hypothetical protein [Chloroflexota bacterium]MBT6680559.1 hypothetical protein [Chloroflexota bacterium]
MAESSETLPPDDSTNPVDPDRLKASMSRLMGIYSDISDTAATRGIGRCPYKDAKSRCTAKFPCRNQFYKVVGEKAICTGSDDIDYRSAWET